MCNIEDIVKFYTVFRFLLPVTPRRTYLIDFSNSASMCVR